MLMYMGHGSRIDGLPKHGSKNDAVAIIPGLPYICKCYDPWLIF